MGNIFLDILGWIPDKIFKSNTELLHFLTCYLLFIFQGDDKQNV